MKRLLASIRGLFVASAICFLIAFISLVPTIFGVVRAFNDIASKGSASPAVVAVGVSQTLVLFVVGTVLLVIAIACAIGSRRSTPKAKT